MCNSSHLRPPRNAKTMKQRHFWTCFPLKTYEAATSAATWLYLPPKCHRALISYTHVWHRRPSCGATSFHQTAYIYDSSSKPPEAVYVTSLDSIKLLFFCKLGSQENQKKYIKTQACFIWFLLPLKWRKYARAVEWRKIPTRGVSHAIQIVFELVILSFKISIMYSANVFCL